MKTAISVCTVMRRKFVTIGRLSDGKITETAREWVTEECGSPLFGAEREAGICGSCASGWTHPHNHPVKARA